MFIQNARASRVSLFLLASSSDIENQTTAINTFRHRSMRNTEPAAVELLRWSYWLVLPGGVPFLQVISLNATSCKKVRDMLQLVKWRIDQVLSISFKNALSTAAAWRP